MQILAKTIACLIKILVIKIPKKIEDGELNFTIDIASICSISYTYNPCLVVLKQGIKSN